ncbi:uncharacterized protein K460DRAFT_316190 [Cucurbitaria berberidis CBS 394.84]|uniref:Uncharacterized protein n=1 Tax=Cucurbitaria berberidis CBS 394.84 TaxID=1168544 RepID=A0A9P4GCZ4_9PLEO|nr:uncharacterized protein K460DRAFT_316190 [Cucurbitaria berberidis CBS 394.84]KAF1843628.1 hypothetical protein K460DRAFT_316190 [Cucurbitaria berberidis CBS 394.84]
MTSHSKLEKPNSVSPHDFRRSIRNTIQNPHRLLWLGCATVSLLSARHLLVEQNVHSPLQLYIYQLAAAATFIFCLHPWRRKVQETSEQEQWKKATVQGTLMVAGAHCLLAISMSCTMQAILHFRNFPVLIFMTTIAYFVEGLILFVAGLRPQSRAEILRLCLLVPACAGILITEYRLRVPSLLPSILAMLFAGIASALRKLAIEYYPGDMADRNVENRWLVGMGALVAVAWVVLHWPRQHIFMFDMESVPMLAINACFSAAALLMGGSVLFPMDTHSDSQPPETVDMQSHRIIHDTLTLLTLIGIVGCYSTLSLRRSYISWYQLGCFILAMLCISSKAVYTVAWRLWECQRDNHGSYELVTDTSILPPSNNETTTFIEESNKARLETIQIETRSTGWHSFLVSIAMVMIWTSYLLLNFTEREGPRVHTALNREYTPNLAVEVVLSMYKEPVDEVAQLISNLKVMPSLSEALFTIYIKDSETDTEMIKNETGANSVTLLPNIGREGETYLNHIVNRWDTLAKQTIFLQANIHDQREFYSHLNNYFKPGRTGFLSLGWSGSVCNCDSCGDEFFWRDETHLFPTIQSRINNATACRNVLLSYKGQFVVSAARIRGIDKAIYHDLQQAFIDEKSWAHQEDYLRGRSDSMSQPWFGYTMERMWNLLFQCNDMDVAWKCPTLLSRWRIGGDVEDCQCFD